MAPRRRVTIRDIARHVGVSPATVSVALSGPRHAKPIGADTRQRVLAAAEALGYDTGQLREPRARARTVAVFTPGTLHPNVAVLYPALLHLSERLSHQGVRMLVESGHGPLHEPETVRQWLHSGHIDGAVVVSLGHWAEAMVGDETPVVFLGPVPDGVDVCSVNVDDELGGRLAAEHLWTLGHRNLAALHLWHGTWARHRATGFLSRLEALGQTGVRDITLDEPTEDCLSAALADLMCAPDPPTALFCDADWLAAHAVRVLREMGFEIPEDVSVVGFDDAHYSTLVSPALTTVRQPYDGLAAIAVQLLLEQVAMGRSFARSFVLPCELVVRGSTSPCSKGGE